MDTRHTAMMIAVIGICAMTCGCQSQQPQQTVDAHQPKYTLLFKADAVEIIKTDDARKPGMMTGQAVPVDQLAAALKKRGVNPGDDVGGIVFSNASRQLQRAAIDNLIANGWRREQFYTDAKK